MVEHGDAVGELGGVMVGQQEAAGPEPDVLGLHQRLRHQKVGRGMGLPGRGVVLADPGFGEAQLVEPADHLQVPLMSVLERPLGRMRRHGEISELHRFLLSCWRKSTTIGRSAQEAAAHGCGRAGALQSLEGIFGMARSRRAVFVCCDGLGRDWVRSDSTPVLHDIAGASLWCAAHNAVFPSVTRVSAASVSTGCFPARHGLHGNRMGLIEGDRIVVRDVGNPDFRTHMRRATGGTLLVPALAERVAGAGGFIAFSNVSPGAAYFLDPEHFGHVYHRAGSYAPGGDRITGADALEVSHDAAGDWAMTQRFCREVLGDRRPAVAFLWLCDPDPTLHGVPPGSA